MIEEDSSLPTSLVGLARVASAAAAVILLILALLDPTRRALFLVAGFAAVLLALFAVRLVRRYRAVALITLNTLLLFCVLEVTSAAVLTVAHQPATKRVLARLLGTKNDLIDQHYLQLPYYARQVWAREYWKEQRQALLKTYAPYVIWRSPAFAGETMNVDERGRRVTPGAECGEDALKAFVFGGSAIWGWGSPDWGTIPAYLQQRLDQTAGRAVCVTNFGENAYVSTQDLIQLYLELQASNVPDLVIFYNGVNEVLAAHQNGAPVVHQNLSEIADAFSRAQGHDNPLRHLNTFQLFELLRAKLMPRGATESRSPVDVERLSHDVAAAYLRLVRDVGSLAAIHGFEYAFFWQPHILAGNKHLTPAERDLIAGLDWVVNMDDELRGLFQATYRRVAAAAAEEARLFDLTSAFDDVSSQLWIDTWGHVTPEGNAIVAAAVIDALHCLDPRATEGPSTGSTTVPGCPPPTR